MSSRWQLRAAQEEQSEEARSDKAKTEETKAMPEPKPSRWQLHQSLFNQELTMQKFVGVIQKKIFIGMTNVA